mmetsp:Transcript_6405/g.9595  ORF Transcript_6405/g.9595 Transcript_6405/m.9595 type:complete len:278 (-) Transcript_6405:16-849(-)
MKTLKSFAALLIIHLSRTESFSPIRSKSFARSFRENLKISLELVDFKGAAEKIVADEPKAQTNRSKGRKLLPLSDLKTGQKLIGSVVEVKDYAVFLDCGISRSGAGGRVVSADGFLHFSDIQKSNLKKDSLKKGSHLTVYAKEIFPNNGRYTLTLDPFITKKKATFLRKRKRENSEINRRRKREEINVDPSELVEGKEVSGVISRITSKGFLVDIKTAALVKMPIRLIRMAHGGDFIENLRDIAEPGQKVVGRVVRRESEGKVSLDFVRLEGKAEIE